MNVAPEVKRNMAATSEKPSETFVAALVDSGSLIVTCDFCDRTHFATGDESLYEPSELADLRKDAARDPDGYVEHGTVDSVSNGVVDGRTFVADCPCNAARRFEDGFWANRYLIASYFELRAADAKGDAERQARVAGQAHAAVCVPAIHVDKVEKRVKEHISSHQNDRDALWLCETLKETMAALATAQADLAKAKDVNGPETRERAEQ